jgi:hypothetical protein
MIELSHDEPFESVTQRSLKAGVWTDATVEDYDYYIRWCCNRCRQLIPDKHLSALKHNAEIVKRRSLCRLIIAVVAAAMVGGLTVATMTTLLNRASTVEVTFAIGRIVIGGSVCLFLYAVGAFLLGMFVDKVVDSCGLSLSQARPIVAMARQAPSQSAAPR